MAKVVNVLTVHSLKGKILSFILFLVSTALLIKGMGLASGIFSSTVLWVLLAGLVLLFIPFHRPGTRHLLVIGILIFVVEVLITKL